MDSWKEFFLLEKSKDYYTKLEKYLDTEYTHPDIVHREVFPPRDKIFRALDLCDLNRVKVVIIGQDPYHEKGQANGLAFSVNTGVKIPPSLRNIYKEVGQPGFSDGDLTKWAESGVMLLNTIMTVRESKAMSHSNKGWETFTDALIRYISGNTFGVCFMLWGANAISKENLIKEVTDRRHTVIKTSHPSPLSAFRPCGDAAPFLGSNCFRICKALTGVDFNIASFTEI